MTEIDLAGIFPGVGDEVGEILGREILAQRDDAEGLRHHRNRNERIRRKRQFRIDRVGRGTGAGVADRNGITIRLGARRPRERGRTAGARDILDHDRLPERLAHLFGHRARDHVRTAAGRERHDHGDGTFWEILRVGSGGTQQRRDSRKQPRCS